MLVENVIRFCRMFIVGQATNKGENLTNHCSADTLYGIHPMKILPMHQKNVKIKLLNILDYVFIGFKNFVFVGLFIVSILNKNQNTEGVYWLYSAYFAVYFILNVLRLFINRKSLFFLLIESIVNIYYSFSVGYIHLIYLGMTAYSISFVLYERRLSDKKTLHQKSQNVSFPSDC